MSLRCGAYVSYHPYGGLPFDLWAMLLAESGSPEKGRDHVVVLPEINCKDGLFVGYPPAAAVSTRPILRGEGSTRAVSMWLPRTGTRSGLLPDPHPDPLPLIGDE